LVNEQDTALPHRDDGATELENCSTAPEIKGITRWLNTGPGRPEVAARRKVVLIDQPSKP
jgi:hypothetical protein